MAGCGRGRAALSGQVEGGSEPSLRRGSGQGANQDNRYQNAENCKRNEDHGQDPLTWRVLGERLPHPIAAATAHVTTAGPRWSAPATSPPGPARHLHRHAVDVRSAGALVDLRTVVLSRDHLTPAGAGGREDAPAAVLCLVQQRQGQPQGHEHTVEFVQ
jgi:hypothetical protein